MQEHIKTLRSLIINLWTYDRLFFFWYVLDIVLQVLLPILQLSVTAKIIHQLVNQVEIELYIQQVLLWMMILLVFKALASISESYLESHGELFRSWMSIQVMEVRIKMDYPLIIDKESQQTYNKAVRTLDHRGEALNMTINRLRQLITSLMAVVLYIGILSQLDPIFLILISCLTLILIYLKIRQQRLANRIQEDIVANQTQNVYLTNTMGDQRIAKDVRIYSMVDWFKGIQDFLWDQYRQIVHPEHRLARIEGMILLSMLTVMSALAYYYSIQAIVAGQISVENFVVYVSLVTMVTTSLTQLVTQAADFIKNLVKVASINQYVEQEPVFNHQSDRDFEHKVESIELIDVSYTYPNAEDPVIRKLNLKMSSYEKLAIVGENGAGKTTLIKLILGLIQPDSGQILINGQNRNEYAIEDYYQLFAPVFQDHVLYTFSIKETIIQGYPYQEDKYLRVLQQSGMDKVIENFADKDQTKIVRQIDSEAIQLSGGQMQKLMLAKALYKDAPVLILDEPTAALDPMSESEVYQNYLKFAENKMALFISHRLASTQFCDRIIYLSQGEIVEEGSHHELLNRQSNYYHLFETQAYYYRDHQDLPEEEPVIQGGVI